MPTIHTDETTQSDLKAYCKKMDITQGDFVKFALAYFRRSGTNPADPPQSVKEELAKIEKRVSQLIAFQKTFEKENLLPLLEAVTRTDARINQTLSGVPDQLKIVLKQTQEIGKVTNSIVDGINTLGRNIASNDEKEKARQAELLNEIKGNHSQVIARLNAIMEHGAGVGGMVTASIRDRYEKQKK